MYFKFFIHIITFFICLNTLLATNPIKEDQSFNSDTNYRVSNEELLNLVNDAGEGKAEAQYKLALIQLSGEGLKDRNAAKKEAYTWLEKATHQDYEPARNLLMDLESNLTPNFEQLMRSKGNRATERNNNNNTLISFIKEDIKQERKQSSVSSIKEFNPIKIHSTQQYASNDSFESFLKNPSTAFDHSKGLRELTLVEFDTLMQSSKFKGEEFRRIEKEFESSVSSELVIKYLKSWPSVHYLSFSSETVESQKKSYASKLQELFYNEWRHSFKDDKFKEAKVCLTFAYTLKLYDSILFNNFRDRAQRSLKNLLVDKDNRFREAASSEILYWAWKHRQDFSFFADNKEWLKALKQAASSSDTSPFPKAQYRLGLLYERGGEGLEQNLNEALKLLKEAAEKGYKKAQLYLDYLNVKDGGTSEKFFAFYSKLAEEEYPYAQFVIGEWEWFQNVPNKNLQDQEVQQAFFYLLNAARQGIGEAQERLNDIHDARKDDFYHLYCKATKHNDDQALLAYLKEKATLPLIPYAYHLAQMYEDGRGMPFETSQDWLQALNQAEQEYKVASAYNFSDASKRVEAVQQKIDSVKKAQGYLLNKIRKGVTVSFGPDHPLFEEFSAIINQLYKYSPGARYLGACLIQQLLETPQASSAKVVEELLEMIQSKEFKDQLREDEPEVVEATRLFAYIVNASQKKASDVKQPASGLTSFINHTEGFIFKKIKAGMEDQVQKGELQAFSPSHYLFKPLSEFVYKISKYKGSVPEHGAHIAQQLLYFPLHSHQAEVLIYSLLDLINSEKFQDDAEEDMDDYRVEKLAKLNQAIELTRKSRKLLSPFQKEQEGDIPEKLKVNKVMFRDPRIQVFNTFFEQEEKEPFNRGAFYQAVQEIIIKFDELSQKGKVTKEVLYDEERKEYGDRKSLYDLLTNGEEKYKIPVSHQFGHRLLKIHSILTHPSYDEDSLANLLGSWAASGLHCMTRSEGETHKFYNLFLTQGQSQESETATLEMKVALILADLRRQLLHKFVQKDEAEPLHQIAYLEKVHGKKLGLSAPQDFKDPHEKVVKERYRNLRAKLIKSIMQDGDPTFNRADIEPGKGYNNPDILIEHVQKVINTKVFNPFTKEVSLSPLPYSILKQRFEENYGDKWGEVIQQYYDEDGEMITPEGVKALLFSFGYLEKDLGTIIKKK